MKTYPANIKDVVVTIDYYNATNGDPLPQLPAGALRRIGTETHLHGDKVLKHTRVGIATCSIPKFNEKLMIYMVEFPMYHFDPLGKTNKLEEMVKATQERQSEKYEQLIFSNQMKTRGYKSPVMNEVMLQNRIAPEMWISQDMDLKVLEVLMAVYIEEALAYGTDY